MLSLKIFISFWNTFDFPTHMAYDTMTIIWHLIIYWKYFEWKENSSLLEVFFRFTNGEF